jgi:hypothetical protein
MTDSVVRLVCGPMYDSEPPLTCPHCMESAVCGVYGVRCTREIGGVVL